MGAGRSVRSDRAPAPDRQEDGLSGARTIAAIATAPGPGAVAMVRISGPDAFTALAGLLADGGDLEPRQAHLRELLDPRTGRPLDRGLVVTFPGPDSYTGEDVAEVWSHGGTLIPAMILEAVLAHPGVREAERGEFTRRAYLHGKLDLVQAEAVLDLVEGRSRALHGAALHQLDRGLSERVAGLRSQLVGLEALLVHHLDFPEEDAPPTGVDEIAARARELAEALDTLARTAPEGVLLRRGAMVVLAGAPNAGKSSLFNALMGEARALVTEVPGTTRDAIEAEVSLGSFPFRLVDTAGLRRTSDRVERLGVEVAERYLASAQLVLFCRDPSAPDAEQDQAREAAFVATLPGTPVVEVLTKAELGEAVGPEEASAGVQAVDDRGEREGAAGGSVVARVRVSSHRGDGLDELRALLPRLVFRGLVSSVAQVPVLTRERQARGVRHARDEVEAFAGALASGVPPEAASAHLKEAASALEDVVGVVAPDEVLDQLFASFCIGK